MLKGRSIIFIAFLLFIWELIIRVADIPHWLLPAPSAIMIEGIESYSTFIPHVWATIQLALLGLAIGVMCGLSVAVFLHRSSTIRAFVYPILFVPKCASARFSAIINYLVWLWPVTQADYYLSRLLLSNRYRGDGWVSPNLS
ncbi:hypothetical protein LSPH24S_00437 [Lysinibacillus sphaericus]